MQMLTKDLIERAEKRRPPTQPFIDHHTKSVLIRSCARSVPDLFRCHVDRCSRWILSGERAQCVLHYCNAKVTEDQLLVGIEQDILWFDIPMDNPALMRII